MAKSTAALDFKSATFHTLRLVLHTHDTQALTDALRARLQEAGGFFTGESIVLDARQLDQAPDWPVLIQALRQHQLYPIGLQAADDLAIESARAAGLAPLDVADKRAAPATPPRNDKASDTAPHPPAPDAAPAADPAPRAAETLVIRHPLRSGQRIYARNGDLIVLGMVSQGAEVIADGHVHVYGPLRGKAVAGAQGNPHAMILTTQLEPELLSIAGVYRVIETQLPKSIHQQAARVELDGSTLRIHALNEPNDH